MKSLGPNTDFKKDMLHRNLLICAGENQADLVRALRKCLGRSVPRSFRHRCFEIWRYDNFALVLSGMGTGCIEPLMHELLSSNQIEKVILFGTAGLPPGSELKIGVPHFVSHAKPWFTGLDRLCPGPSQANWPVSHTLPSCKSLSTDLFYLSGVPDGRILKQFAASKEIILEMEVSQFYYMCRLFAERAMVKSKQSRLAYAAIKVPVNVLGKGAQQLTHTRAAIVAALRQGLQMLE